MSNLPYFRWYPADAEGDDFYAGLTDAEGWTYTRLLNRSWMNDGIPADLNEMARVLGKTRGYLDRVWMKLSRRWEPSPRDPSKLINPRQEIERKIAIRTSENNKRDGNANAKGTRSKREENGSQHARAGAESEFVSGSSGEEIKLPNPLKFPSYRTDENFLALMGEFESAGYQLIEADRADAYGEWKLLSTEDKLCAIIRFREKREGGGFPDPTKIMRPDRWLKRKEFHRRFVKSRDPTRIPIDEQVQQLALKRIEETGQI